MKTKGIVIYDTSYGNTKKIAETVAETLKECGIEVDLFAVKNVKKLSAKDYNFLILGSPTKFGTMSFAIRGFLGKVKSDEWMNKPFAAFDTENPENVEKARAEKKEWSAAEKISDKLREKKMNQLMPVLKTLVSGWKGPLVEGEIERTKEYTRELAAKLEEPLKEKCRRTVLKIGNSCSHCHCCFSCFNIRRFLYRLIELRRHW